MIIRKIGRNRQRGRWRRFKGWLMEIAEGSYKFFVVWSIKHPHPPSSFLIKQQPRREHYEIISRTSTVLQRCRLLTRFEASRPIRVAFVSASLFSHSTL